MTYSLYFHIPFCVHRCAYCDFNTYAGQEAFIPAYVEALVREIEAVAASAPDRLPVHTIFFGGGTPSLLSPEHFERILGAIRKNFDLKPIIDERSVVTNSVVPPEISLEANPGTVSLASLKGLRKAGFNRISFGVQSSHPEELRLLERIHDFFDVIESVKEARQAGFENLNLDLIYGLPQQTLERWQESLKRAVGLNPEHLSLYALTIEHDTPFGRWMAQGLMPLPDPDAAADMYEWASQYLQAQGYEQYEISNWARPGYPCRHNLQYWRNEPYLGFGAGAHGCAANLRIANIEDQDLHRTIIGSHPRNFSVISRHGQPGEKRPDRGYAGDHAAGIAVDAGRRIRGNVQETLWRRDIGGVRQGDPGIDRIRFDRMGRDKGKSAAPFDLPRPPAGESGVHAICG